MIVPFLYFSFIARRILVKQCTDPSSSLPPFENLGGIMARRILVRTWIWEKKTVGCLATHLSKEERAKGTAILVIKSGSFWQKIANSGQDLNLSFPLCCVLFSFIDSISSSYWRLVRTMCGSRTDGWSLPCVMSD
jgi:hypothetical protein